MPLSAEQTQRLETLAREFDASGSASSFYAWLEGQGEGALAAELEAELRAAGDSEAVAAIHAGSVTPDSLWQSYVDKFDAPTTGGPWALNKFGRWFEVSTQAPGGRVATFDGRLIYVPAQHPDGESSRKQILGGDTSPEKRWSEQKFRMARAAILQDDPRALWFDLFFRVAPRGSGPFGSGRDWYETGGEYTSEGGERWPELEATDPLAQRLESWWLQDFGHHFIGQGKGNPLSWLRVYCDPQGYRRYKAWTQAELREFLFRYMLGAHPGVVCTPDELAGYLSGLMAEQARWHQAHNEYSSFWPFPITPYSYCDAPTQRRHKKVIRNMAKAAAIAGVVWAAVAFAPAILPKLKAFMATVGPKLKGAAGAVIKGKDGQSTAAAVFQSDAVREAVASGELPPPPSSTADPAWQDYATLLSEWYLRDELEQRQRDIADAGLRQQRAQIDAADYADMQAELRREVTRATREIERVAAGDSSADYAAASFLGGDDGMKWLGLGAAGLVAALLIGRN